MSKRITSHFFLAAVLFLSGCGGDPNITKIRFWNGFTGPDGRTILKMVRNFNRDNPDIHVTLQRVDWGTYYNKLFVAGIGDRAPDVFIIHTDVMPRFTQASFIQPLNEMLNNDPEIAASDFDANSLEAVTFDDQLYAIPLDIHPFGLWYNKTLLAEAGFVDENGEAVPPRNQSEFLEVARKTTLDLDGDGTIDQWGFVFTWLRNVAYSVMNQWDAEFFSDDLTDCNMNAPPNVEALQFCVDLIQKHKVAPSPENFDAWIGFRQGKVAMCLEGIWMLSDLQKQTDLDYGAAPIPVFGHQPAVFANGHNMCMKTGLNTKQQQAAWRFIRYLSNHSLDWAEAGPLPARPSLRNTERFHGMGPQMIFSEQIPYARFGPRVPFIFEFYTEYDFAIERALRGSMSSQQALDAASARMNETISRHNKMLEYAQ